MRFTLICLAALLIACAGGSTAPDPDPDAALEGHWNAVSLNGSTLPVNYTVGALQIRAVYRNLTLGSAHSGQWNDSTQQVANGVTYYSGHHGAIYWWSVGSQINVNVRNAPSADFSLTFDIQSDGSLLETHQDAATVIYRR